MKNVKLSRSLSRSVHLAVTAIFLLSFAPSAWSEETTPGAAPPATTEMSNEGVPPAPAADPGMGAGSPEEAPPAEKPAKKKKKKKKHNNY